MLKYTTLELSLLFVEVTENLYEQIRERKLGEHDYKKRKISANSQLLLVYFFSGWSTVLLISVYFGVFF